MREKIKELDNKFKAAAKERNEGMKKLQGECPHDVILERPDGVTNYSFIENSYFPAVKVCANCGLVEEKRNMTPLYNTYVSEKNWRMKRNADYQIDEKKLEQLMTHRVNIKEEN